MHRGVRIEVHAFGQASPKRGLYGCRDKATSREFRAWSANTAAPVISGHTSAASATSEGRLNGYAITFLQAPAAGSLQANLFDYANWLMAGYDGKFQSHRVELTVVLVNVAAAQAAGFNSHDGIVSAYTGNFEILHLVFSRADLNSRSRSGHCPLLAVVGPHS
jgi:hypothetical protein